MDGGTAEGEPEERGTDASKTDGITHTHASDGLETGESGSACINYSLGEQWVYNQPCEFLKIILMCHMSGEI